MDDAIDLIRSAAQALADAADILSDIRCDRWADVGGVGRPPKDSRIDALYALAVKADEILEGLSD